MPWSPYDVNGRNVDWAGLCCCMFEACEDTIQTPCNTPSPQDVPWSPYDVDGRNYDWPGLAAAADMLFVMAYDTQSQVGYWHYWFQLLLRQPLHRERTPPHTHTHHQRPHTPH